MALRAAFPSGPIADASGNLAAAWRGFFQSLYTRTGDANGVSTSGLTEAIVAERAARANADQVLDGQLADEAAARTAADAAEATARASGDAGLQASKVSRGGDTMSGTLAGPTARFTTVQATTVALGLGAGPTWTSGVGVPTATAPIGSLFSRTDGTVGSTIYVSAGGGTWNAVAGV